MAYNYEALYRDTPNALGAPTPAIVDFFAKHQGQTRRVLDIGCGQGRDALFIARAGHRVVGVDLSPSGIKDLTQAANAENLQIQGLVADITAYTPDGLFDILLIDRTLHMLPELQRLPVLAKLLTHVTPTGWCVIADEPRNLPAFKQTAAAWRLETETRNLLILSRTESAP